MITCCFTRRETRTVNDPVVASGGKRNLPLRRVAGCNCLGCSAEARRTACRPIIPIRCWITIPVNAGAPRKSGHRSVKSLNGPRERGWSPFYSVDKTQRSRVGDATKWRTQQVRGEAAIGRREHAGFVLRARVRAAQPIAAGYQAVRGSAATRPDRPRLPGHAGCPQP
jgi:hypothetical protein